MMLKEEPTDKPYVGPRDNPTFRLSTKEALDSNLVDYFSTIEKIAQIRTVSLEEALLLANNFSEGYRVAVMDCINFLQKKRFDVTIEAIDNGIPEEPSFILTSKHYEKGAQSFYGVPNFNFLREEDGLLERGERLDSKPGVKKVMTSADAGYDFSFNASHAQIESFENIVRVVLSPGDGVKPYQFNVQYSPKAFLEGMQHLAACINGQTSYCHLFHEVLRNKLRENIRNASSEFVGEKFVPEIDSQYSKAQGNTIALNTIVDNKRRSFVYKSSPGAFETPFPVIEQFKPPTNIIDENI